MFAKIDVDAAESQPPKFFGNGGGVKMGVPGIAAEPLTSEEPELATAQEIRIFKGGDERPVCRGAWKGGIQADQPRPLACNEILTNMRSLDCANFTYMPYISWCF